MITRALLVLELKMFFLIVTVDKRPFGQNQNSLPLQEHECSQKMLQQSAPEEMELMEFRKMEMERAFYSPGCMTVKSNVNLCCVYTEYRSRGQIFTADAMEIWLV